MYGFRGYGASSYAGLTEAKPLLISGAGIRTITATLNQPVVFITETVGFLSITATLIPPSVTLTPKEISIFVNSVEISDQVSFTSLSINNNIYSEPTTASFNIIKSDSKSYTPTAGDEIEIYDTGVLIFAGLLIRKDEKTNGLLETYQLQFKDWTEELSTFLIAETYTGETAEDIIADMFTDLTDYDLTNVSDTTVISQFVADNISVTEALDNLAELSGKYWFVSPDKEIYFFEASTVSAPFDLTDENGKYYYSSLEIGEDLTQIRNKVTIKGKGIASVTVEDATSQSTYGLRQYYEMDNNISATNEATQKANAILASYKDSIKIATFETKQYGLFAGQQIDIDSTIRGLNETMTIESLQFQSDSQNRFKYIVKATTERLGRLEDLFETTQDDTTISVGDQSYLQDISFTAIDNETIQWSSGTITTSDGTSYSVSAKASQDLTASHVIYLDPDVSTTVLQISTTFSDGIGGNKIPLCYAIRTSVTTKGADIFPVSFGGKIQIDGGTHISDNSIITDNIASNAITANEISANAVTATKINVSTISAISANLGTVTAGTIQGNTITGGTITGTTITASGGAGTDVIISNNGVIYFRYGNDNQGILYCNSSGDVILDADNSISLISDGTGDDVTITAGDTVGLIGNKLTGLFSNDVGIYCDEWIVGYNDDNDSSDAKWYSNSALKMALNQDGDLTIDGEMTASGYNDFAEWFESVDGKKILVGTCVFLDNGKIREAKKGEQPIGVISATAGIVLNNGAEDAGTKWGGKYLKNDFGECVYEEAEFWSVRKKEGKNKKERTELNKMKKDGCKMSGWSDEIKPIEGAKKSMKKRKKLNQDYDENQEYIPRKERPEWNVVGLLGQVRIKKGQPIATNWIKLKEISANVDLYLIK